MENSTTPQLSVSQFVASLNQTLEYAYPIIEIEGEVASFKVNQQKYVFFDLKDESASVGCFMTVWQLRVPIEDGMKVIVRATPKITAWGKFSLTVQTIRPSGEGSIKKSFELLKEKLEKEGLFDEARKRSLPTIPTHIGVISSTQAAGYADFVKILDNRFGGVRVDVAHVQVQGEGSADQIIRAIEYFNTTIDIPEVLVIIRGGGSADDLSTFNDERLARAIAASRVPTLVGVGHEVDVTLADLVADVRAATPSNAAQIVVPDRQDLLQRLTHQRIRVLSHVDTALERTMGDIQDSREHMIMVWDDRVRAVSERLGYVSDKLTAYDPRRVLARGYAILTGKVAQGERITIERYKDIIEAEVHHVTAK
ncbi:MAG: exodeoxyribonuclease VII large subunit [Candidatus Saccharimonas sp.]